MPSPSKRRSLLAQRVLDLVGEDWINGADLMEKAIPLVPPGKALRKYRRSMEKHAAERDRRIATNQKTIAPRPTPPEHEQIRIGARDIINDIIGSAADSKLIEREHRANRLDRWIRLNPQRRWSHHCCLHGGTCDATARPPEPDDETDQAPEPEPTPEAPAPEQGEIALPDGGWGTITDWLEQQGIIHTVSTPKTVANTTLADVPRHPYPEDH